MCMHVCMYMYVCIYVRIVWLTLYLSPVHYRDNVYMYCMYVCMYVCMVSVVLRAYECIYTLYVCMYVCTSSHSLSSMAKP